MFKIHICILKMVLQLHDDILQSCITLCCCPSVYNIFLASLSQSNPFSSVNFLPTETDNFLPLTCRQHAEAHYLPSAVQAHIVVRGRYPTLFTPRRWNYPDSRGAPQMWEDAIRNAVYINTMLLPPHTPKINLISCHNCSGKVASRKLIPTEVVFCFFLKME